MKVLTTKTGRLIAHGTPSSYSNHKCRCDECREAWNVACARKKRERVGMIMPTDMEHGRESGYQRGCRCEKCKRAHADYRIERDYNRKSGTVAKMREDQQGLCACCFKEARLVIDHIHGTKHIRGLLCVGCNTAIGKLGDALEGVMRAVDYLKRTTP